MATSKSIPPIEPWFIGWAFWFKNAELKIDFLGSPFEFVQQMKQASTEPKYVATHIATQIGVSMVHKVGRVGKFRGGPNSLGLMRLLDTTVAKDRDAARQVLGEYPTLLTTGDH